MLVPLGIFQATCWLSSKNSTVWLWHLSHYSRCRSIVSSRCPTRDGHRDSNTRAMARAIKINRLSGTGNLLDVAFRQALWREWLTLPRKAISQIDLQSCKHCLVMRTRARTLRLDRLRRSDHCGFWCIDEQYGFTVSNIWWQIVLHGGAGVLRKRPQTHGECQHLPGFVESTSL